MRYVCVCVVGIVTLHVIMHGLLWGLSCHNCYHVAMAAGSIRLYVMFTAGQVVFWALGGSGFVQGRWVPGHTLGSARRCCSKKHADATVMTSSPVPLVFMCPHLSPITSLDMYVCLPVSTRACCSFSCACVHAASYSPVSGLLDMLHLLDSSSSSEEGFGPAGAWQVVFCPLAYSAEECVQSTMECRATGGVRRGTCGRGRAARGTMLWVAPLPLLRISPVFQHVLFCCSPGFWMHIWPRQGPFVMHCTCLP